MNYTFKLHVHLQLMVFKTEILPKLQVLYNLYKKTKQETHPSHLITCSSLLVICSLSRGPNLNLVQRDWRAGIILVKQLPIKQNLVFSVNFSITARKDNQVLQGKRYMYTLKDIYEIFYLIDFFLNFYCGQMIYLFQK